MVENSPSSGSGIDDPNWRRDSEISWPVPGDPLARHLASAWRHTVRAFTTEEERYRTLCEIDAIFRQLIADPDVAEDRLPATFLVRCHGAFLATASLALSGQIAESYVMMRGAMTAALHGMHIAGSPERRHQWLNRSDDQAAQDRAASLLSDQQALENLREVDADTARIFKVLHERMLDRGAHPNTYANLSRPAATSHGDVTDSYFVCDDELQRACLRTTAQAGICCLSIFYYAFAEQYRALQLGARINDLRKGH